ncbi:serine/threonine-protein kinase [Niveomyces insectorum RCEF 264]|uniref:Serine/threonine-protein kinase n=1 Tax=Niveomyces insectorum RCEF 264 TaxID=1081102 RepID=A0A167ZXB5_9HYPO|nr:serine/threonine-protein kinase [Niveomyces insectorum RCEF 264]
MLLLQPLLRAVRAVPTGPSFDSGSIVVLLLVGLVFLVLRAALRVLRALRSPLRYIPGPFLAQLTPAALRWHELRGGRTRYVHALHRRYGPAVRLGPNEVSYASAAAVKAIYNTAGSGYDKTAFYDLFTHARRRRILADRYAKSNILRGPSVAGIEERSQRFVRLCRDAAGGVLDIYQSGNAHAVLPALHAYAFDCVTHHLFHPYGTDSLGKASDAEIMREVTFDDSLQNRLVSYYSPTLHAVVGRVLALFAKPRQTPLADRFVLDTAARTDAASFTLLSRMHEKQQQPPSAGGFDALDVAAESLDHMAAGIDTTGDALCFLMWELSQPRSQPIQARLRRELRASRDDDDAASAAWDRLPFLEAVVLEGLRCFPAIPMSLPRVVPGRTWGRARKQPQTPHPLAAADEDENENENADGRVVDGYFLPAGTVVSCQAYSVHRSDAAVFPDPDTFNPDRWLAAEGDAERKRLFFAFASGGRGCIGKHLALVEMKILLRDVYSRFATTPEASMTPESMAMSDQLISSRPVGQRCVLQFAPLDLDGNRASVQ